MPANEFNQTEVHKGSSHTAAFAALAVGLVAALGGDAYLLHRSGVLKDEIAKTQDASQTQISKLNEATTTLLQQEQQRLEDLSSQLKGVNDSASVAIKRARAEAMKQSDALTKKIAEQQDAVSTELTQIKDNTASKFTEVATDVDGVKANVETVKTTAAATQNQVEQHSADLKRVMGDMGVMSGLIATNSKDLDSLRALGERNYYEFELSKADGTKKIGDVTLTLKKADSKRSRFSVDVFADDKHVEKKDKTINEPVQIYVGGITQPYEIVVNQVKKDQVIGYLSTPKVKLARR